jgi:hypothetical protein
MDTDRVPEEETVFPCKGSALKVPIFSISTPDKDYTPNTPFFCPLNYLLKVGRKGGVYKMGVGVYERSQATSSPGMKKTCSLL